MKKTFLALGMILVFIVAIFLLTGCDKVNGEESKNDLKKENDKYCKNTEVCTLTDKWNGVEVKFAYPKDAGFETEFTDKSAEFQRVTLKNKDKNCKIQLQFTKVPENEVEKRKTNYEKDEKKYSNFKEIEYAGFKGCTIDIKESEKKIYKAGILLLKDVGEKDNSSGKQWWYGLTFSIEKESMMPRVAEFDAIAYFDSEEFQNLLNSIQSNDIKAVEVDGVLALDKELVIKEITDVPSAEYKVVQFRDSNGITCGYKLPDGKYKESGVYFRVSILRKSGEKYKNLQEALDYYMENTWKYTYSDKTYAGQVFKVKNDDKTHDAKYSTWESGMFEKDGIVYDFLYYSYEEVPVEYGEQLIKDVLSKMDSYKE